MLSRGPGERYLPVEYKIGPWNATQEPHTLPRSARHGLSRMTVKDVAPGMISDILADGFEGGAQAERQRAEAAAEAHGILEEV